MKPRLIIQQKITMLANKYKVHVPNQDGTAGQLVALAQQKRLAFKEKVSFYSDESKNQLSFTFRAEKVMDFHGRFLVEDQAGTLIGIFKKDFTNSLVNSTWHILNPDGSVRMIVKESNATLAAIRRFGGSIPFVGGIVDLVVMFLKYHFIFVDPSSGQTVGKYTKTTLFRDHYMLELTDEAYQSNDWRVISSVTVALDALQGR